MAISMGDGEAGAEKGLGSQALLARRREKSPEGGAAASFSGEGKERVKFFRVFLFVLPPF